MRKRIFGFMFNAIITIAIMFSVVFLVGWPIQQVWNTFAAASGLVLYNMTFLDSALTMIALIFIVSLLTMANATVRLLYRQPFHTIEIRGATGELEIDDE